MLEWAGISFGEDFTYKLSKSLKVSIDKKVIPLVETRCDEWSSLPSLHG